MEEKPDQEKHLTDFASDALIAEYEAVREASLSRDQISGSLENFMMLTFSATLVGLPTIIIQKQYILLLILSLLVSALALARRGQGWLRHVLANYENEVLRPNLQKLLRQASHSHELPSNLSTLWSWQDYLDKQQRSGSVVSRVFRRFVAVGLGPLSVLASVGYLLLYLYYRGLWNLDLPEGVLFVLSLIYSAWVVVVYFGAFLVDFWSIVKKQPSVTK
jgi:hypothetical protein